jgi:LysR family cys regulon transcriptional activator
MSKRYYKVVRYEHFQSFCEVARLGSFEAAARRAGLSRTTLWQQVDALGRELRSTLFRRKKGRVELTDDGRLLLEMVHTPLTALGSVIEFFHARSEQREQHLRVATIPGAEMRELLAAFQRRHPTTRVSIFDVPGQDVVSMVENGTCDVGFCLYGYALPNNPVVHFEAVGERDVILITPPKHPLAHRRRLTLRDLAEQPLILVTKKNVFRDHVDRCFDREELLPRLQVVVESDRLESHEEYARLGLGISIAWPTPGRRPPRGLHYRSLNRFFGRAPQYLLWRKGVNFLGHVQRFVEHASAELRRWSGEG